MNQPTARAIIGPIMPLGLQLMLTHVQHNPKKRKSIHNITIYTYKRH